MNSRGKGTSMNNRIGDVGVFNPEFNEESAVKFKVVVPGMNDMIICP